MRVVRWRGSTITRADQSDALADKRSRRRGTRLGLPTPLVFHLRVMRIFDPTLFDHSLSCIRPPTTAQSSSPTPWRAAGGGSFRARGSRALDVADFRKSLTASELCYVLGADERGVVVVVVVRIRARPGEGIRAGHQHARLFHRHRCLPMLDSPRAPPADTGTL